MTDAARVSLETGATVVRRGPLDALAAIAGELGAVTLQSEAASLAERVADGRYYVACIGQFKRGKSTLLNALIGVPVLPAGIVPVTAVPTVVRHGATTEAFVRLRSGGGEWRRVATGDLAMYVSEEGNPENRFGVDAVEIFTPAPLLAGGMCLVDTPGVGSVFAQNSETTTAFVPHIDAAIVVIGVDPPLAGDELTLIEAIAARASDVVVVLNKADRFDDAARAEAAKFARRVLSARLGRQVPEPLHVSAARQIAGDADAWDWRRLEAALAELHAHSGRRLVQAAQERGIARIAEQCLRELREQRDALLRPVAETEQRLALLDGYVAAAQREAAQLDAVFAAEQRRLSELFAARCQSFLDRAVPDATAELAVALRDAPTGFGPSFRERARGVAREIARRAVEPWLDEEQRAAEEAYRTIAARFVEIGERYLTEVAATGQPGMELLPTSITGDASFRVPSRYYFRPLHALAASSPLQWLLDAMRTRDALREAVGRDAGVYLANLLHMNCTLVANDLDERVLESRRRLESEIHSTLDQVTAAVSRALNQAKVARATGTTAIAEALERLAGLERATRALSQR